MIYIGDLLSPGKGNGRAMPWKFTHDPTGFGVNAQERYSILDFIPILFFHVVCRIWLCGASKRVIGASGVPLMYRYNIGAVLFGYPVL